MKTKVKLPKFQKWLNLNTILLIILIGGFTILTLRLLFKKDYYKTVEILVSPGLWWEEADPPWWLADSIKPGDVEIAPWGKKIAEIKEVKRYEYSNKKVILVKTRLLVSIDRQTNTYRFRHQPLEIGETISLSPGNIHITGSIVSVEWLKDSSQYQTKRVTVKLYQKRDWLAQAINVGDASNNEEANPSQAKIISKKVNLAELTVVTWDGRVLIKNNPLFRDIELEMELTVLNRGGINYFNHYQPVKVGNKLLIPMKNYNLEEAEVMAISPSD